MEGLFTSHWWMQVAFTSAVMPVMAHYGRKRRQRRLRRPDPELPIELTTSTFLWRSAVDTLAAYGVIALICTLLRWMDADTWALFGGLALGTLADDFIRAQLRVQI